ncbi:MAG: ADP-ribosylglycohydrolase family protein [Firmicutes bacterium]|nr:ADP-ribosylglycohydrolase family protein [Bacillota bacterium]
MIGAIIGDIAGSRYERRSHKSKEFDLFHWRCHPTDDSIMSLAVAEAILACACDGDYEDLSEKAVSSMQRLGRIYRNAGYGRAFYQWIFDDDPKPYHSYGNGSAMRVSPCGFAAASIEEAKELSAKVTKVTHDHPEGMKGAEAIAVCVFLAKAGHTKDEIRTYIQDNYYNIDFTIDEIRDSYKFDVSCQGSVPVALEAFLESTDFEDAIRTAISVGGDSDTIAAMAGSVAEAYYGVPEELIESAIDYLDGREMEILNSFEKRFPSK